VNQEAISPPSTDEDLKGDLFALWSDMAPSETRTFWTCTAGWTLDAMDLMMFSLATFVIAHQWAESTGSAGFAATVSLLTSAAGGWGVGLLSDRLGRVNMLKAIILWFAAFSLLSACAQNFQQLVLYRALLGFGFGGEWSAGAVLLAETIRPHLRGRAMGCTQAGWAIGWACALLVQALAFSFLPSEIAWRAMFVVGSLPALIVFFLRRLVEEPAMAVAARNFARPNPFAIFAKANLRITALAALASTGAQGGYYAITLWLPSYLRASRHLSVVGTTPYLGAVIFGSFSGYLIGAWLADRLGRKLLFYIFATGAATTIIAYTKLSLSNDDLLVLGFVLGVFSCGYYAGLSPFLTELFPTKLRGSGVGFTYNFGRGLGSIFPTLIGYLTASLGFGNAIVTFAIAAYAVFLVSAGLLPETRGRDLRVQGS
jgi:MFS family permease